MEEDSEWIDYAKPVNIGGETVGTFNFTEQPEEEVDLDKGDREQATVEKTKTWNIPTKSKVWFFFPRHSLFRRRRPKRR